jgi:hypothetical protein
MTNELDMEEAATDDAEKKTSKKGGSKKRMSSLLAKLGHHGLAEGFVVRACKMASIFE